MNHVRLSPYFQPRAFARAYTLRLRSSEPCNGLSTSHMCELIRRHREKRMTFNPTKTGTVTDCAASSFKLARMRERTLHTPFSGASGAAFNLARMRERTPLCLPTSIAAGVHDRRSLTQQPHNTSGNRSRVLGHHYPLPKMSKRIPKQSLTHRARSGAYGQRLRGRS